MSPVCTMNAASQRSAISLTCAANARSTSTIRLISESDMCTNLRGLSTADGAHGRRAKSYFASAPDTGM